VHRNPWVFDYDVNHVMATNLAPQTQTPPARSGEPGVPNDKAAAAPTRDTAWNRE
jgi:hypothetical protein